MAISETEVSLRKNDDRRLSLIDVSSADDSLIVNNDHSENEEWLRTPNSRKFDDAASKIQLWEQEPQPDEIERPKQNSKCNLRKSLAWDKAFFTSAGVLDPEELSSIIEGVVMDEKGASPLPGIQEDVNKSCESISTFESDGLSLESLEADLFVDVRASIQKFSKKSNVAPASAKCRAPSGFQTGGSSKKVAASYNMAPSSKSPSASMQGIGKLTKKNPVFPQLPQNPVARRAEPSILKQPKALRKSRPSSTISSKRASPGDPHAKNETDNAKRIIGGKVNSVTNTPVIKGSRVIAPSPKPTMLSKSPSDLSVARKTKFMISSSSSCNLSGNIDKSPLNSLQRKVDAGAKKPLSSCSVVRTPSKIASRDKIGSSNSSLSSSLSVTKLSCILPACSISDLSPQLSSSSSSIAKYRSNSSRTRFDNSSSRKDLSDIDARQGSNSQNCQSDSSIERKGAEKTDFTGQRVRTAASVMVLPQAPKRPSGLRRPSPEIGFFDGVKSSVHTSHEGMQPHSVVPHSSHKHGVGSMSPIKGQNKTKLGKLQPKKPIIPIENKNINQKTSHPIPLHESSDVVTKPSMALQHVTNSSSTPEEVQNKMHLKVVDADNTITERHLIGIHDLNPGSTRENCHYNDEVDCLSRQVGFMDINLEVGGIVEVLRHTDMPACTSRSLDVKRFIGQYV